MKKTAIVTLADTNYFELLVELIDSIKRFEKNNEIAICVLDAGLDNNQKKFLLNKVDVIKPAVWDFEVPNFKVRGKEWLKAMISRAFLPKYFPDYENFIWIDCDAWLNDWEAINLLTRAAKKNKIGLTQSVAPGYRNIGKVNWLVSSFANVKTQNYKHAKKSGFSEAVSRQIAFAPHINSGVFSLNKNSNTWNVWQEIIKTAIKKGGIFASEQIALNIAVYCHNVPTEFLSTKCNWIVNHLLPKFDEANNKFVEPNLPNDKIGIIHLAGGIWQNNKDMRLNKDIKAEIKTINGETKKMSLRFNK
jgi:hypothetical protein|tara:strand:- start:85 stop:996 length:912 start_codon:yes stop_codon:yes gene_type:complete